MALNFAQKQTLATEAVQGHEEESMWRAVMRIAGDSLRPFHHIRSVYFSCLGMLMIE